jgi:hypothetical protein
MFAGAALSTGGSQICTKSRKGYAEVLEDCADMLG